MSTNHIFNIYVKKDLALKTTFDMTQNQTKPNRTKSNMTEKNKQTDVQRQNHVSVANWTGNRFVLLVIAF